MNHKPNSDIMTPTPFRTFPHLSAPFRASKYFLPYQDEWIADRSRLKIIQKSRQAGISYADAYDSVIKASPKGALFDVWVSSRDEAQAKLYLEDCKHWARVLQLVADDLGEIVFDAANNFSAYVLQFNNGRRIYCLSSNPNALAGKRGHVKLDEFALHHDQRLLYRVAKPVTTWGGTLSIISTHRGANSVFNQLIRDITENGNPMGWSLHTVPIRKAVEQGLVERINSKSGGHESREEFLERIKTECIDEEQWLQEYCCVPADESSAFITFEMIHACETDCLRDYNYLLHRQNDLYLGMDTGRKHDLSVIDVGEKIGDVVWDRYRIILKNKSFSEQEHELYRLLALPRMKRACIDATGLGMQLAERARQQFGWKVEPITFTAAVKEEMAYRLRAAFEDKLLRIASDLELRADLRGIKKEVTTSGHIRFAGESEDSHCDRFWALALRLYALSSNEGGIGAMVGW